MKLKDIWDKINAENLLLYDVPVNKYHSIANHRVNELALDMYGEYEIIAVLALDFGTVEVNIKSA